MTQTNQGTKSALPDNLSLDPKSRHFNETVLASQIGIRFNGMEKTNVEEYCISESWVRVPAGGKSKDRYGNPMTVRISGTVEVYEVEG